MSREPISKERAYLHLITFVLLLPVLIPFWLVLLAYALLNRAFVYFVIRLLWLPRGRDVLLIYSDSTIWKDYVPTELLPLVRERAYVLNWSERRRWPRWSFPVHVFKTLGGEREFNPLVIVFFPLRTEYFRFWNAFRDAKRGDMASLDALMADLRERLR